MKEFDLFAFVLIPFDKEFEDTYNFGIKETAEKLNILAERVDEQIFQEGILDRIYRQIEIADIIIADMSGQNPNVFYEVGFAHAKNKICILLTKNAEDIPFDLKHHRHIIYNDSIKDLREQLTQELKWAKKEIQKVKTSHIKVTLTDINGDLTTTKYWAEGKINIKIDLSNETDKPSADIDAIYFYSSKGWTLSQDQKECGSTKSDITGIESRHFLNPPIRRLNSNSWAQLKFEAKKILAWYTEGDELKEEYRVTGKSILRLVTAEGNFDYDILIDVLVDSLPF